MANADDPTIPLACAAPAVPTLNADTCEPELNYGPISNLYITQAPFAATPTALEIARRLALAATDPDDPEAMALFMAR
jgi:hypothetical protein